MKMLEKLFGKKGGVFEMFKDVSGNWRFHLKAKNNEIIASSEGYEGRGACYRGVETVIAYAKRAKIQDKK